MADGTGGTRGSLRQCDAQQEHLHRGVCFGSEQSRQQRLRWRRLFLFFDGYVSYVCNQSICVPALSYFVFVSVVLESTGSKDGCVMSSIMAKTLFCPHRWYTFNYMPSFVFSVLSSNLGRFSLVVYFRGISKQSRLDLRLDSRTSASGYDIHEHWCYPSVSPSRLSLVFRTVPLLPCFTYTVF